MSNRKIDWNILMILCMAFFIIIVLVFGGLVTKQLREELSSISSKNIYYQDRGYEGYECEIRSKICYCYKIEDGEVIKYYIDVKGGKK